MRRSAQLNRDAHHWMNERELQRVDVLENSDDAGFSAFAWKREVADVHVFNFSHVDSL